MLHKLGMKVKVIIAISLIVMASCITYFAPSALADAPTWPDAAAVTATNLTTTSITIAWPVATNADSYNVLVGGTQVANVTDTSYTYTGTSGSSYVFSVQAVNSTDSPASTSTISTGLTITLPYVYAAMTDPVITVDSIGSDGDEYQVSDEVNYNSDLNLTLKFSGPNTIYNVDTNNITFYQADDSSTTASLTMTGPSSGTLATATSVVVTVPQSFLEASTDYILLINYDDSSSTNIRGNNTSKVIGKDVYFYMTTKDLAPTDDITAPTWGDAELTASDQGASSLTLNWDAASDNLKVDHYSVYQDSTLLEDSTTNKYYQVTDLLPGKDYTFNVYATDTNNNTSEALSLTTALDYQPVFLTTTAADGKAYGIEIQPTLKVAFLNDLDATVFAGLTSPVVLQKVSGSSTVAATVTLADSSTIQIVPDAALEYGTEYELTLDAGIMSVDGAAIAGTTSFNFVTVDDPPVVRVYQETTPVSSLQAGQTYTVKALVSSSVADTPNVMIVVRSGKGARLEYGGDVISTSSQSQAITAGGSYEFTSTFTLPADATKAAYVDVYTMDQDGNFKTMPVQTQFTIE